MVFKVKLSDLPYSSAKSNRPVTASRSPVEGDFKPLRERAVSKTDYSYLLAPRELRPEYLNKPEIFLG